MEADCALQVDLNIDIREVEVGEPGIFLLAHTCYTVAIDIRDVEVWGSEFFYISTCSLHCHHQNDCMKMGSCVSHFKGSLDLSVRAKLQDSVDKPLLFFKERKENRSRLNQGPCLPADRLTKTKTRGSGPRLEAYTLLSLFLIIHIYHFSQKILVCSDLSTKKL